MTARLPRTSLAVALAANALILAALAYAAFVEARYPDFYYRSVQEDEYLEWASFWAFLLAALVNLAAARQQRRATGQIPWFLAGLGLFCFVVAMEEISWAQRVFGYRPPPYFLEHNYQQELNLHNVMATSLRKTAFRAVMAGYGIVLPLAALVPPVGRLLGRLAVTPTPALLVPSFAAALWTYVDYPWKFSGEIVELVVGLGFLFAALLWLLELSPGRGGARVGATLTALAVAWLAVAGLGVANAAVSRFQRSASPEALEAARRELEALRRDFKARARQRAGRLPIRCGVHKRLYTFTEQYDQEFLREGDYVGLTAQGLPEERAEFFIDPWNDPYWVRAKCSDDRKRRSVFLYSFGPNRLRDSSAWNLRDDDVGIYLVRENVPDDD